METKEFKRKPDIWAAYKGTRKNAKVQVECFTDTFIDDILTPGKRKPVIPDSYEILDIGIGENFGELYKKKYKVP
jgi:hypothetical protein